MSRIENSTRICPITRSSTATTDQRTTETRHDRPTGSYRDSASQVAPQSCRIQNSNERRLNYALQSKKTSDVLFSGDSSISDIRETMYGHSNKLSTPSTVRRNVRHFQNEPEIVEQDKHESANSSSFVVDHLEAAISNVELGNGMENDNNNCMSTEAPHAVEKVGDDAVREVETIRCEGGGEEIFGVEATAAGTRESVATAVAAATRDSSSTVATLQILAASKQDQNGLKPILKRKDFSECVIPAVQLPCPRPPPILKKRDSLTDSNSSIPLITDTSLVQNAIQLNKPASILKNRQQRGSHSFDDNHFSVFESSSDDGAHHLKPILKKKSWSIEVSPNDICAHSESFKSILKSSEKLTTSSSQSSSSSRKTSLDSVSPHFSPCFNTASLHSKSTASPTKATLKGILKASPKNRSASISPCSSSEYIIDESEIDRLPLSPQPSRNCCPRKASLQDSIDLSPLNTISHDISPENGNYDQEDVRAYDVEPTSHVISFGHILKRTNEPSFPAFSLAPNGSSISHSISEGVPSSEQCFIPKKSSASVSSSVGTMSAESSSLESICKVESPDISECKDASSMNLTVLRPKNDSNGSTRSRPKSCFVTSSELFAVQSSHENDATNSSSIAKRLALLKQNGEEGWKNRVHKVKAESELEVVTLRPKTSKLDDTSARSSVIANRLSSLMESQTQWRSRVSESDAKQFTVASKQSRQSESETNTNMDSTEKIVLRDTPKRIGLRGSTLNESALNSVSAKLNSVLRPERSLLAPGPITPIKKRDEPSPLPRLELPQPLECKSTSQTVFLSKPDDEESFGSFFELDNRKLDNIIDRTETSEPQGFLSLDSFHSDSHLLSNVKKSRIQAPKRRAASSHNPIKQLNKSCILVDSYSNVPNAQNDNNSPLPSPSAKTSAKVDVLAKAGNPNLALSALAGLASTEDFKSVANKLRNSSAVSSSSNDSWRAYDLKNSLQSKMLILVKGRHHAQIRLIEPNWRSLNLTDSFILVMKDAVYAYIGELSNIIERTKCIEVAEQIRKRRELCYRSLSNELVLIDGQTDAAKNANLFTKLLPLLKELDFKDADKSEWEKLMASSRSTVSVDEDDQYYEESLICTNMIYEVTEGKSNVDLVPVEKYWGRRPRHQLLQSESVFVFDFGTEMYIWLGKNVSNVHRKKAVEAAKDLWLKGFDYSEVDISPFGTALKSDKRPDWAWFTRINQNMETALFKDKFINWPAFTLTRSVKKAQRPNSIPETQNTHHIVKKDLSQELNLFPVDAEKEMIHKQYPEPNLILENVALGRGPNDIVKDDDGLSSKIVSLEVQCFYIGDSEERVELTGPDSNFLFSGESYYIRWKYRLTRISRCLKTGGESKFSDQHGGRDRLCYFVWQGKDACNTQRGTTALNAIDKLREEGASQEIIENGKEPPAFLRIFDGNLVILLGKRSLTDSRKQGYRMFTLKSTLPAEMFLEEVPCSMRNLRSRTSFIFINALNSKVIYLWHGCKTLPVKRKLIKEFLDNKLLASKSKEFGFSSAIDQFEIIELNEGEEPKVFYEIVATSGETTLKRSSRSNLQRECYFSLLDDTRDYLQTPRLFQFTTTADRLFAATEIAPSYRAPLDSQAIMEYPFTQDDLYLPASTRPTFFLLDNQYEVYLWESKFPFFISAANQDASKSEDKSSTKNVPRMIDIENEILSEVNLTTGSLSQLWQAERQCALETTLAYCHAKNTSEPPKSYVISAGLEPPSFCGLFPTWTYYQNVAQLHIEDGRKPGQQILVQEVLAQLRDIHTSTYSYEVLKSRPLPEGINILCIESYLDDQEFEKIFGFNREEFYSLPTWKQRNLKQEKELF